MVELDRKDWKILYELDLNSRQSLNSIGKKVGLSKEVVNYRIKKMVDEGIITNFFTRINTFKLGIMMFRTFVRFYNLSPEKEKELVNYLVSNENVGWAVLVDGSWDLNFIYWAENIDDFHNFFNSFLSKFGGYIEDKWISLFVKYTQYHKAFLSRGKVPGEIHSFLNAGTRIEDFDQNDIIILSLLAFDSRINLLKLAKKTNLSPKTIANKIKKLTEKRIILGYGISLNLNKIGYDYFKLHLYFKRFDKKIVNELLSFCQYSQYVIYANELIGGTDLELDIYAKDRDDYHKFLDELRYRFPELIKDFETLTYREELKHNLFPRGPKKNPSQK